MISCKIVVAVVGIVKVAAALDDGMQKIVVRLVPTVVTKVLGKELDQTDVETSKNGS